MTRITRRLLREDVYGAVFERIVHGGLTPGMRVRDTAIAEELGVSRTPVREALVRLSEDGFLTADAGRGFRVRGLALDEVLDTYPILWTLEGLGLRSSAPLTAAQLARLDELNAALSGAGDDVPRRIALDEEWHRALLAGCRNRELLRLVDGMKRRMHVYEHHYWQEGSVEQSTQEHERIARALAAGDLDAAVAGLEDNFRGTMQRLARRLQSAAPAAPR
ncbi:MAG TPA: GntR family transcriptional regulator [Longimicrobium sp.]|nr:GntR family transcriptional regulator [Longimicrobium sp.]